MATNDIHHAVLVELPTDEAPERVGRILIPWHIIRDLLKIPDAQIHGAYYDPTMRAWEVVIEHPDLKEVSCGDAIPVVAIAHTKTSCGHICDLGEHSTVKAELY